MFKIESNLKFVQYVESNLFNLNANRIRIKSFWIYPEQHILVDQRLVLNQKHRQLRKQCWIDIIKILRSDESLNRLYK